MALLFSSLALPHNRSGKANRVDPELVRFGLLCEVYDKVEVLGRDFKVPILEVRLPGSIAGYLLGGASGSDFLVRALVTTS